LVILALYGSPRSGGFSARALDLFLGPMADRGMRLIKINAYKASVRPCIACEECAAVSTCIYDDMDRIYSDFREARGIIISSPVYFSSIPGPLKNIIDRCQLFWEEKRRGVAMLPKKGFFIATAGAEYKTVFQPSLTVIKHFYSAINCDFNESDSFLLSGVDNIDGISDEQTANIRRAAEKYLVDLERITAGE
jgi:multimeric flavodoxin WrbA